MIRICHISWLASGLTLCCVLMSGCGPDPKPPPDTAADATTTGAVTTAPAQDNSNAAAAEADKKGAPVGIDERIIDMCVDEEISIGDYVLTGGEIPAMAVLDAVVRLLPGAVGGENATEEDSFGPDWPGLEYPQYTRPREFRGMEVPEVKRLKQLEQENARLKKLLAERDLEVEVMKEIAAKKW